MRLSLPSEPNIEKLRKQAKQLLKAHKSRDPSSYETLKLLNRFARSTEREVLESAITLHQAQIAIAKAYGFENWNKLKMHVESKGLSTKLPDATGKENAALMKRRIGKMDRNKIKAQIIFFEKLGCMLMSQVAILDAFRILRDEAIDDDLKTSINDILTGVASGKSMNECMDKSIYSPFVRTMIEVGETKGNLDVAAERIARCLEKEIL